MNFVKANPEYESDLDDVVLLFSTENNGKVYEQLGDFYMAKGMKEDALRFMKKGLLETQTIIACLKTLYCCN